jgi:hypothetical protein
MSVNDLLAIWIYTKVSGKARDLFKPGSSENKLGPVSEVETQSGLPWGLFADNSGTYTYSGCFWYMQFS